MDPEIDPQVDTGCKVLTLGTIKKMKIERPPWRSLRIIIDQGIDQSIDPVVPEIEPQVGTGCIVLTLGTT